MALKQEYYSTRKDGVELWRTYSDEDFYIRKENEEFLYEEAIDVYPIQYTYVETDIPIERPEPPVEENN